MFGAESAIVFPVSAISMFNIYIYICIYIYILYIYIIYNYLYNCYISVSHTSV